MADATHDLPAEDGTADAAATRPAGRVAGSAPTRATQEASAGAETTDRSDPGPASDPALPARATLGRYRLLGLLGRGGMGVVWKAWDDGVGRFVALKQLHPERLRGSDAVARFLREARVAAGLRHPGIVEVHDLGVEDDRPYLALEFVEGRTLEAIYAASRDERRGGSIGDGTRLRAEIELLAQAAEAVGYAHAHGVVHRDLKPANVLVDAAGRAHVADFGLAREYDDGSAGARERSAVLTLSGQALGTPVFMSPEQATGETEAIGPRSDVWALGVILYELLTGSLPFAGETATEVMEAAVDRDPERPRRRNPAAPEELERVCLQALDKEPGGRYADGARLAADLRRWLRGEPVEARGRGAWRRWSRALRRRRQAVGIPLLVLFALAAAWLWVVAERTAAERSLAAALEEIGARVEEMEDGLMRTDVPAEAREALGRQPLEMLERLLEKRPAFGPAYAWRGESRALLDAPGADEDFDHACALAPESPWVWYLRGRHALRRYAVLRGHPGHGFADTGVRIANPRPETETETVLRQRGLDDLQRMAAVAPADGSPRHAALRLGLALAAAYTERSDGCATALELVAGLSGPRALRIEGKALYGLQRFDEAHRAFARVLEDWPCDRESRIAYALARTAAVLSAPVDPADPVRGFDEGVADLDRALAGSPDLAHVREFRAVLWMFRGRREFQYGRDPSACFRQAVADLDLFVRRVPGVVDGWVNRGLCRVRWAEAVSAAGGDPRPLCTAAIVDFDEALRLAPGSGLALCFRASAHLAIAEWCSARRLDDPEHARRALADCEAAARDAAARPAVAFVRGRLAIQLGDREALEGRDPRPWYARAQEDLEASMRRHGEPAASHHLGIVLVKLGECDERAAIDASGRYREAAALLEESLTHGPPDPVAHDLRGIALSHLGKSEQAAGRDPRPTLREAIRCYDRAIELDPARGDPYSNRGIAWKNLGQAEAARGGDAEEALRHAAADLEAAVAHGIDPAVARFNQGNVLRRLAEVESARGVDAAERFLAAEECFAEVLRSEPRKVQAWAGRGLTRYARAQAEERRGRDAEPALVLAEADLKEGARRRDPIAFYWLGLVRAELGRFREAIETFQAYARALPAESAEAEARIADVRRARDRALERGRERVADGVRALGAGDADAARAGFERGLDRLTQTLGEFPEDERARRAGEPGVVEAMMQAHVGLARLAARRAERETDAGRRGEERDRALRHLESAAGLGPVDAARLEAEPDLAGVRGDVRFRALLERGTKEDGR